MTRFTWINEDCELVAIIEADDENQAYRIAFESWLKDMGEEGSDSLDENLRDWYLDQFECFIEPITDKVLTVRDGWFQGEISHATDTNGYSRRDVK